MKARRTHADSGPQHLQKRWQEDDPRMTNEHNDASAAQAKAESVDVNSRGYRERVFDIVRRIPSGRVMTYGQLAEILGEGYTARTVGFVMHSADQTVPWQRVINAQGACSTGRVIVPPDLQQRMLTSEGVEFNAKGRCDL